MLFRSLEAVMDLAVETQRFRPRAVAHNLAERVGISMSAWADSLASDEALRKVAEEIFVLTNSSRH